MISGKINENLNSFASSFWVKKHEKINILSHDVVLID
jgi:hypothetical protein